MENKIDIKISVIGNAGSGKTSLIKSYINASYHNNTQSTIGIDFFNKYIVIDDKYINIKIYDTAGQERYNAIVKAFYRDIHGILLIFDLTNIESFYALNKWLIDIYNGNNNDDLVIVLVGTKNDLNIIVSNEMIYDFCVKYKLQYVETSAKNNINVELLFDVIIKNILKYPIKKKQPYIQSYYISYCCYK